MTGPSSKARPPHRRPTQYGLHQTLCARYPPPTLSAVQTRTPRARPNCRRPRIPSFTNNVNQQSPSPPETPLQVAPPETRRRGRTLIWSRPPAAVQAPYKTSPSRPGPMHKICRRRSRLIHRIHPPDQAQARAIPSTSGPASARIPPATRRVRRRIGRRQIAPALERPPRPP